MLAVICYAPQEIEMLLALLVLMTLLVAYSNGANENFKGVATLHGSKKIQDRVVDSTSTSTVPLVMATELMREISLSVR
jgi:PiT family inorganic phosphate transporter